MNIAKLALVLTILVAVLALFVGCSAAPQPEPVVVTLAPRVPKECTTRFYVPSPVDGDAASMARYTSTLLDVLAAEAISKDACDAWAAAAQRKWR
jgi:hypothetical protein